MSDRFTANSSQDAMKLGSFFKPCPLLLTPCFKHTCVISLHIFLCISASALSLCEIVAFGSYRAIPTFKISFREKIIKYNFKLRKNRQANFLTIECRKILSCCVCCRDDTFFCGKASLSPTGAKPQSR